MIPVPEEGVVQAFGDIILARAENIRRGKLVLEIDYEKGARQVSTVRIGAIAVGGPYGKKFACNDPKRCEMENIAAGDYWLLCDKFDPVTSRWQFTMYSSDIVTLKFKAIDQRKIERVANQ